MVNCCEAVAQKRLLAWVLVICCEEETKGESSGRK